MTGVSEIVFFFSPHKPMIYLTTSSARLDLLYGIIINLNSCLFDHNIYGFKDAEVPGSSAGPINIVSRDRALPTTSRLISI